MQIWIWNDFRFPKIVKWLVFEHVCRFVRRVFWRSSEDHWECLCHMGLRVCGSSCRCCSRCACARGKRERGELRGRLCWKPHLWGALRAIFDDLHLSIDWHEVLTDFSFSDDRKIINFVSRNVQKWSFDEGNHWKVLRCMCAGSKSAVVRSTLLQLHLWGALRAIFDDLHLALINIGFWRIFLFLMIERLLTLSRGMLRSKNEVQWSSGDQCWAHARRRIYALLLQSLREGECFAPHLSVRWRTESAPSDNLFLKPLIFAIWASLANWDEEVCLKSVLKWCKYEFGMIFASQR